MQKKDFMKPITLKQIQYNFTLLKHSDFWKSLQNKSNQPLPKSPRLFLIKTKKYKSFQPFYKKQQLSITFRAWSVAFLAYRLVINYSLLVVGRTFHQAFSSMWNWLKTFAIFDGDTMPFRYRLWKKYLITGIVFEDLIIATVLFIFIFYSGFIV